MDGVTFKRVLKWGFLNFFRNSVVSVATVLVMSLSIFMIGAVLIGSIFMSGVISSLEEKVDVSVYFKQSAPEEEIKSLQKKLEGLAEVKSARYISRDEALQTFQERHKNDELIIKSLSVVEGNPFSASLEIRAKDSSQYEAISRFLENREYGGLIDTDSAGAKKITYRQNQAAIDKLAALLRQARMLGFGASVILALIAILVAHNTMRLAIYNSKDEISVMQLVGASRAFIRGPFLVEGIIHGILASAFTLAILYPALWWLGQKTATVFGGLNVFSYFTSNLIQISVILFAIGIFLGLISSALAMRRYLKV